jgi:hypothetical protein
MTQMFRTSVSGTGKVTTMFPGELMDSLCAILQSFSWLVFQVLSAQPATATPEPCAAALADCVTSCWGVPAMAAPVVDGRTFAAWTSACVLQKLAWRAVSQLVLMLMGHALDALPFIWVR